MGTPDTRSTTKIDPQSGIAQPANLMTEWDVWFECTGGLYTTVPTGELLEIIAHGTHRITQILRRPLLPPKGGLGGPCECQTP
jgi:hypothetical protein